MITIVAKIQAAEGKQDEVRAAMEEMIRNVKEKEGGKTLAYSLHVSDEDPTQFLFYEQYSSADAIKEHGASEHMAALNSKLKGNLAGRPTIERYTQIAGID